MHLELVELLRCPNPHAASVLVAASDKTNTRYIVSGVLGCPECGAEYAIRDGVTLFEIISTADVRAADVSSPQAPGDDALRVAAQLAMSEGRSVYGLVGFASRTAIETRALVSARMLLINPADLEAVGDASETLAAAPAGIVRAQSLLPLVLAKFDGIAFATSPEQHVLEQAVNALKSGGRLVAPATCEVPVGMIELARDERDWVAARDSVTSAPIGITRR